MRLVRLLLVVLMALTFELGWSQALPEDPMNHDISKSVHIFPNPASEFVNVKIEDLPASKVKLTLHNIIGNIVEVETEVMDEHELRLRVKDLASGYYFIAIKDEKSISRGIYKFVKR